MNIQTKKRYSFLRYLVPLIAIFFGIFYWLEGFGYFIKDRNIRIDVSQFTFFSFWFLTICYLFIKFKGINFQSKMLVFLSGLSISLVYYVMLIYNHTSEGIIPKVYYATDYFIIQLSCFMSILGIFPIVVAIIAPNFQARLNYLTNINRIKNRESSIISRFLEIWASFPVFMGIHSIFFLLFSINNTGLCNVLGFCYVLPLNYVLIIVVPWLFLMVFYIVYTSVVGLKK